MSTFLAPISEGIWDMKYRFKEADGTPIDGTVEESWRRIAHALADAEKDEEHEHYAVEFYKALEGFKFLPAGRITAGAGTSRRVTLFNCLASETLMLTAEYGLVPIGEIAGEHVTVLDANGDWVSAPIIAHGEQSTAMVTLRGGYNGRETKIVRATAGHRWPLVDGRDISTEDMRHGDVLKTVRRSGYVETPQLDAYRAGVRHGAVYGDGSQEAGGAYRIRLCGAKIELGDYFTGWSKTQPPSYEGDVLLRGFSNVDMKGLPEDGSSATYLSGFLHGWFATDGAVCVRDRRPILTCGADEADWLRSYGAVAGMEVSFVSSLSPETNFGKRNKALFNVSFHRWTMTPLDFLRKHHREAFGETPEHPWVVESVGDFGEPEPVFCPSVSTTGSFQLDLGIHTKNCFVMGTIPDSMDGIFDMLKEAALTMQQGGGIGYDFSTIRPKGALVEGVAADASGPLTFMDVWDSMCRTVMSAGSRRGAMMATMRCDHPDILDFVKAKQDSVRLRMFNLSVLVTDAFMAAVKANRRWDLVFNGEVYETVEARDLWDQIMEATYAYAEPGVIFIDRVNETNNLRAIEKISSTNPCAEQPLPPYGACLLGSINLAALVENPFEGDAGIDHVVVESLVATAVRMMDNVVDVSGFPLIQQQQEAEKKRRIGLGITGLADALAMCGLRYGSQEAVSRTERWCKLIAVAAYKASVELAKEKGAFPAFNASEYLASGTFASTLPEGLRGDIAKHGIRNSHLVSIAPTGTISLYAGNVSSGIEPIFAYAYTRKVLQKDGSKTEEEVVDYAVQLYRDKWLIDNNPAIQQHEEFDPATHLPKQFVSAQTLTPAEHVAMQAAAQKWIDSSISKTINCPEDISLEAFKDVYMLAYDTGCKGCTTYRPNDVTGSVLAVSEDKGSPEIEVEPNAYEWKPEAVEGYYKGDPGAYAEFLKAQDKPGAAQPYHRSAMDVLRKRPDVLKGETYKIKLGDNDPLYVTITDVMDGDRPRPYEIFISTSNPEHFAWTTALTRMISAVFRRPRDSSFVVDQLKAVFSPNGGGYWNQKYWASEVAAIGQVIEDHMRAIAYGRWESDPSVPFTHLSEASRGDMAGYPGTAHMVVKGQACPKCHQHNFKHDGGCPTCLDCGWSKC